MKRLLRSVIDYDGAISQENLALNFRHIQRANVLWMPPDERIFRYLEGYFQQYLELPSGNTVRDYFEGINDIEAVERLKDIQAARWYIRSNFFELVKQAGEQQRQNAALTLLKEAESAIRRPTEVDGQKIHGIDQALAHIQERAPALLLRPGQPRTEGDIRLDGQKVVEEYLLAKTDKSRAYGSLCGIEEIDSYCRGIKRGELWIHAAYAGELKTAFCLNWAYNGFTHYKRNVLYVTLEMRYEHIRRIAYAMHSSAPKWDAEGFKPLDYRKIRDGELTDEEERFYLTKVIPDFANNPDYTHLWVWYPPASPTIEQIWAHAEALHRQFDVGLVIIDYAGLVETGGRYRDFVVDFNSVVRDAKRMALGFNAGEGVPVIMPFQINRKGKEDAVKNEGVYNMSALSYANEAERSADVVTTSFLDDNLRASNRTKICNLKNRDNPLFKSFLARVDFTTRRLYSAPKTPTPSTGMAVEEDSYADAV